MRDRETIEIALTAAETGHLVFSTLHTIDASKTVDRIIGTFEAGDQQAVRTRLANFRYIVSQRLVPAKTGGRAAVLEILKGTMRTREYSSAASEKDAARRARRRARWHAALRRRAGETAAGRCDYARTALLYATNQGNLQLQIADIPPMRERPNDIIGVQRSPSAQTLEILPVRRGRVCRLDRRPGARRADAAAAARPTHPSTPDNACAAACRQSARAGVVGSSRALSPAQQRPPGDPALNVVARSIPRPAPHATAPICVAASSAAPISCARSSC